MKSTIMFGLAAFVLVSGSQAQFVVPAHPKKFTTRSIGGDAVTGGVDVLPTDGSASDKVRYTIHVVLSESRFWTNTEGKPLEAKLIAFEDMTAEAPKGAAQPAVPAPPPNPTVVRDGKVRLLANQKTYLIPLERLSQSDHEFIADIQAALEKKSKSTAK